MEDYLKQITEKRTMIIAFPTEGDKLNDKIALHFGSAKKFLIYDINSKKVKVLPNPEVLEEEELPPNFLNKMGVNVVIVFGLGSRAFNLFKKLGIKTYKALEKSINENINDFQNRKLRQLNKSDVLK